MHTNITIAGSKGGTGTTTFTVALALEIARRGHRVAIRSHDMYSVRDIIGTSVTVDDCTDWFGVTVADGVTTITGCELGNGTHDCAVVLDERAAGCKSADITVVRNDYPSLAAAHRIGTVKVAVVMVEPGRALSANDAHTCLAVPCHDVPVDPTVARMVDAGMLSTRVPRVFATAVAAVADRFVAKVVAS
jgi:hypothetical protein